MNTLHILSSVIALILAVILIYLWYRKRGDDRLAKIEEDQLKFYEGREARDQQRRDVEAQEEQNRNNQIAMGDAEGVDTDYMKDSKERPKTEPDRKVSADTPQSNAKPIPVQTLNSRASTKLADTVMRAPLRATLIKALFNPDAVIADLASKTETEWLAINGIGSSSIADMRALLNGSKFKMEK